MRISLPINVKDLIYKNIVESDRIEYKSGWNPKDILHTICAFANDLHNWGGGYIVIGVEALNGKANMPPLGLDVGEIDKILGELLSLSNMISPTYFPLIKDEVISKKHVLIVWCPAGDNRPYKAPTVLGKNSEEKQYYIRKNARTLRAKGDELILLMEMTAKIPYDDRINPRASLEDLDLGLIREFLNSIKSNLFAESIKVPFKDLCRQLNIAKGPDEAIRPTNVGLLFFSKHPEKYHERARIEIVIHEDFSGRKFYEKIFKGPMHYQIRDVLRLIKTDIIKEFVVKTKNKAEAIRYFNFPFEAIEEMVTNAVYHKSYEINNPIEIQIFPDRICVLSFPGPIPPVDNTTLRNNKIIFAREYRNRRIGDILKELNLTEGRGTGIPNIYQACIANGSPKPEFETNDTRTYFLATIYSPTYDSNNDPVSVKQNLPEIDSEDISDIKPSKDAAIDAKFLLSEIENNILETLATNPYITREELSNQWNVSVATIQRHLSSLKDKGFIKRYGSYNGYWKIRKRKV